MRLPEGKCGRLICYSGRRTATVFWWAHFGMDHVAVSIFARQGLIYIALNCQRVLQAEVSLAGRAVERSLPYFHAQVAEACH